MRLAVSIAWSHVMLKTSTGIAISPRSALSLPSLRRRLLPQSRLMIETIDCTMSAAAVTDSIPTSDDAPVVDKR